MKTTRPFLFILLFVLFKSSLPAQVQWFQNQDGNNQPPNGTSATSVKNFTSTSFVACYLWRTENNTNIWKLSKTHFNGNELKTFYLSGIASLVEMRVGRFNSLYVLQRNYPSGLDPEYTIYKLDDNLQVKAQMTLSFSNGFNAFNMNCFELDEDNNVYLAGDGQYPADGSFEPASFVMKMNKNLVTQWNKMNHTQTSYTRLHIDNSGKVTIVEDFYTFFPNIYVKKFSPAGQLISSTTMTTDPGRYSLFSSLDGDDDLLLYGGKSIGDTAQGMYLYKISHTSGAVIFDKTHFVAPGSQFNDLKVDNHGKIFSLVTLYIGAEQISNISRINPVNGNISWSHLIPYSQDSCNLVRLAIDNNNEGFYALGQRNSNPYFGKGYAVRMKKNGEFGSSISGPDSVGFQRTHWLTEGILDNNDRLIAVGGTYTMDTLTNEMTDMRAFAVRFGNNNFEASAWNEEETGNNVITGADTKLTIYPNPVQDKLTVSNLQTEGYDRVSVYNMQGALVIKQPANGNIANLDISSLPDGVYLLVLQSSATLKERNLKFVVSK